MGKIISISGTRSVGKTTLINLLKDIYPDMYIREDRCICPIKYNMSIREEYYENERYYIYQQISEYNALKNRLGTSIFMRGPEDLLFYVIHYPKTKKKLWNVHEDLKSEIAQLDRCRSDIIIYLYAEKETIVKRNSMDVNKSRSTLTQWIDAWHNQLLEHMRCYDNCCIVNTENRTREEVLKCVLEILENGFTKSLDME